jgi:uncharacterized protein (TIGR03435 family)
LYWLAFLIERGVSYSHDSLIGFGPRRDDLDDFAFHVQDVAGARGARPFDFASQADGSRGEGQASLGDNQTHGDRGGVPSAGGQALKNAGLGGGFVQVEGLRIELCRKGFDSLLGHLICAGGEFLADAHIVEIQSCLTHVNMVRMTVRVLAFALGMLVYGQEKPARLTFEVASIKPFKPAPDRRGGGVKQMAGGIGYLASGVPARLIISVMYRMPTGRIKGGPSWLDTDLWEIEAKADKGYDSDDLHTMFKNLLADEFKLKFHVESKEGPVYVLTVDKGGLKMKANDTPPDFEIPIKGGPGPGALDGRRVPMEYLCYFLGSNVLRADERPVIDKTGLTGNYDFTLSFLPDLPPGFNRDQLPPGLPPGFLDRPNIYDALKQQLGLKLESQKGPVPSMIIDSVEKPAEN